MWKNINLKEQKSTAIYLIVSEQVVFHAQMMPVGNMFITDCSEIILKLRGKKTNLMEDQRTTIISRKAIFKILSFFYSTDKLT